MREGFGGMGKGSCGSGGALRRRFGDTRSCDRRGAQFSQPDQVVHCAHEGEPPADFLDASQLHFPQQADRLHPAEGLFHAFAFLLADRVAGMPIYGQDRNACFLSTQKGGCSGVAIVGSYRRTIFFLDWKIETQEHSRGLAEKSTKVISAR